jgi:AraC-like DNA-binding protein/ligand-binding sensor protein
MYKLHNDSSSIIKRREIDPLLLKASKVVSSYKKAADCMVFVLDNSGQPVDSQDYKNAMSFCAVCRGACSKSKCSCERLHKESIDKAHSKGGSYIYMCDAGFIYWTTLIFSGGRHIGALSGGNVLHKREDAIARIRAMSGGTVSEKEVLHCLNDIPERSYEDIKALAKMLKLCAEQVSADEGDYKEDSFDESKKLSAGISGNSNYPLDKERRLLAALRRGDNDTARKILRELLSNMLGGKSNSLEFTQLRAIELVVILSRASWNADSGSSCSNDYNTSLEVNNHYIKKIQESKNIAELHEALYNIIDRIGGKIFSFKGIRHSCALRKAERYIWENYTRKLSLQEIAGFSGLSASYFSSIFKEEMGENLSSYLNRLRAEKAAVLLTETDMSLSEIAMVCGFDDQSWFSKIFKAYAGISPGKYREQGCGTLGTKEVCKKVI